MGCEFNLTGNFHLINVWQNDDVQTFLVQGGLKLPTASPRCEVKSIETAWCGLLEILIKDELNTQNPRQGLMGNVKK